MGVVARPLRQAHLGQKLPGLRLEAGVDGLFVGLVAGLLPGQKLPRQHHVFQRGVLGKEVEVLEHEAEVEALFPHLALPLGGGVGGVPHGLARAGGADDGQRLALLEGEGDVFQHLRLPKVFPDAGGFE